MTIENPNTHTVPFEIEGDNHVQDFVVPPTASINQEAEELVETWADFNDLVDYIDYGVDQIRNATALAQAAKNKAAFAQRTARGFEANVEYRRGLIESALNASVSRGLLPKPALKSAEYSLGIQGTAGSVEIDPELDYWREEIQKELELLCMMILDQVRAGENISIDRDSISRFYNLGVAYNSNADYAKEKDFNVLVVKTHLTWDKKYLGQALKNNWLTDKLASLFTVVKGKALVIRL